MGEYKIGYVMKVTKEDDFYFGRIGKIEDRSSNPRQFCLRFAPGNMTAWFYAHELIHLQPDEIPFPERTELAPAQPATADAGEEDALTGVDKVGILEKYLREGKMISAIKAHRRFYGTDIGEADKALKLMKYDMQLREDSQPSYSDLQAKLAAAEARADAAVEAIEMSTRALVRCQPQIKGVLVMQDVQWAIEAGHNALQASAHGKGEAE